MGLRATVVKTYKVEYGNATGFNYGMDFLQALADNYINCSYTNDGQPEGFWEFDKSEFADMVNSIKGLTESEFAEVCDGLGFDKDYLEENGYTRDYVLDVFTGWLDETPEDSDWVRIGWL